MTKKCLRMNILDDDDDDVRNSSDWQQACPGIEPRIGVSLCYLKMLQILPSAVTSRG